MAKIVASIAGVFDSVTGKLLGLVQSASLSPTITPVAPDATKVTGATMTLTSADDGSVYESTQNLVVTVPQGLSPKPAVVFIPKGGDVSLVAGGSVTLNGASTTVVRALSSNPAGFVLQPYSDANGYGVSGS